MDEMIVHALLEINRRFYQDYAEPFAATRRRIQDGVRQSVQDLPDGRYLDLGCGSGALARYWTRPRPDGSYRQGIVSGGGFQRRSAGGSPPRITCRACQPVWGLPFNSAI